MSSKIILYLKNRFFITFFILYITFFFSHCQLKIPLKYYPIYKYNYTTPAQIMQHLLFIKLYADIDMGTPRTTIQLPLYFESNEFYIYNPSKTEFGSDKFSDMKTFNNSETMKDNEEDEGEISFSAYNFDLAYSKDDIFYFNNSKYELQFYFPINLEEIVSGGIGMQLKPYNDYGNPTPEEKSFLGKLKKNKIINNYYFSIFYNSKENKNEEEGFLLLGCLPHEINEDLGYYKKGSFNDEYKRPVYLQTGRNYQVDHIFSMDKVLAYEGNTDKLIEDFPNSSFDYLKVELNYNSGGIRVPRNLEKFYQRVFEEYINQTQCFREKIRSNYFYYCNNNKDIISKIKNVFPRIVLRSYDLDTNFTIETNDIFIEENNYVFCLLYFVDSSVSDRTWGLGKPFFKKYQFSFEYKSRNLYFYNNINEQEGEGEKKSEGNNGTQNNSTQNNGISASVVILIVILTIIIVLIICFFVFKFYLYDKFFRKKKANELDEDFDYTSKEENAIMTD